MTKSFAGSLSIQLFDFVIFDMSSRNDADDKIVLLVRCRPSSYLISVASIFRMCRWSMFLNDTTMQPFPREAVMRGQAWASGHSRAFDLFATFLL